MEHRIIGSKYKVSSILQSNEIQTIYLAEGPSSDGAKDLLINEIKSADMAEQLKKCFVRHEINGISNFVEAFYEEGSFFVVARSCGGSPLKNYLTDNSLRLSDKMYIIDSFLAYLSKLDNASPVVKAMLCNARSISISGKKNICFNMDFNPTEEIFKADNKTVLAQAANILCAVFSNTPEATLETDKDNIPPTMTTIIKKCCDGAYSSFSQVYKDFKASLLYSTFIEGASVDKQVMKNIKKSKNKKTRRLSRNVLLIILFIGLAAGAWWYRDQLFGKIIPTATTGGNSSINSTGNTLPIAKFSTSISKINVGDQVIFINESTDSDIGDSISEYEWTIKKNDGFTELFSNEASASYKFEEAGTYEVSLTVRDSKGAASKRYTSSFTVSQKEPVPSPAQGSTDTGTNTNTDTKDEK